MPIYEYVCEACGRLTEVMQKMTDPAPAACPECGAPKLARLVSRTSFQLKGGGWYADLYSTPKEKKAPAEGGAAAAGAAAPAPAAPAAPATGASAPASAPAPAPSSSSTPASGSGGSTKS